MLFILVFNGELLYNKYWMIIVFICNCVIWLVKLVFVVCYFCYRFCYGFCYDFGYVLDCEYV